MGRVLRRVPPILRDGPDGPPQDEGVGLERLQAGYHIPSSRSAAPLPLEDRTIAFDRKRLE